jgi:hypothetical protein
MNHFPARSVPEIEIADNDGVKPPDIDVIQREFMPYFQQNFIGGLLNNSGLDVRDVDDRDGQYKEQKDTPRNSEYYFQNSIIFLEKELPSVPINFLCFIFF